uniref:Uncharacterized protein n=1 Tax=Panagrolaimus superbus TaxID=310955 RepID=A0A914Y4A1_9BILA
MQIRDDDKVAGAVFSNPSRSRTSVTKTPITKTNTEVSKDNAANLNRSRTAPNRSRTRTTKSTIEYDCKIIGGEKVFNVNRKLLSEKSIGIQNII